MRIEVVSPLFLFIPVHIRKLLRDLLTQLRLCLDHMIKHSIARI